MGNDCDELGFDAIRLSDLIEPVNDEIPDHEDEYRNRGNEEDDLVQFWKFEFQFSRCLVFAFFMHC